MALPHLAEGRRAAVLPHADTGDILISNTSEVGPPTSAKLRLRARAAKIPAAKKIYGYTGHVRYAVNLPFIRLVSFSRVPRATAISVAYQVMLRRRPDRAGFLHLSRQLSRGTLTRDGIADQIRASEEFQNTVRFRGDNLVYSLHVGRQQFIRSLPKAEVIVDLGGGHRTNDEGALVSLGYPYDFAKLTIIDLPSDDRHKIYQIATMPTTVQTRRGPVSYQYRSMTQLDDYAEGSVDLVYSGQSIEHIDVESGAQVARDVYRMLKPGGHFALDTPNGRVTRAQQDEFIDPDHEIEYTASELRKLLEDAGFVIEFAKGLNYAGPGVAHGRFDADVVAGNSGLYDEIEDCYLLCLLARKPLPSS